MAGNPPIIVAGNKAVAPEAAQILLDRGFEAVVVDNVMPELNRINVEAAGRKIREIFINKIIEAKGFQQVESFMDGILMPTPAAVLNAAKLLAEGTGKEAGWGELMAVDPGGATTDVYSVAEGAPTKDGIMWKGMPEPKVKRTVEGDLGMRHSAKAALESLAGRGWCDHVEWEALVRYVDLFNADPAYLPAREKNLTWRQSWVWLLWRWPLSVIPAIWKPTTVRWGLFFTAWKGFNKSKTCDRYRWHHC